MLLGLRTALYAAPDLARAADWYAKVVGHAPYFNEPYYVGFNVGGFELGLVPDGTPAAGTPQAYWGVANASEAARILEELGAVPKGPIQDVGGGIRVAEFLDPFGNAFGIIENPHFSLPS